MLLLIEGDGDSFAKRAEMYYRRRPELICAVEEAYKVFRALADRYDLLSKDFQNANHTIATVFPEQLQFAMSTDDEEIPKIPENFVIPEMNLDKIPQVPKAPAKDLKTIISKASKQFQAKKMRAQSRQKTVVKSGLTKEEALEEINKLQKEILSLQTVKEFVKSSYESGIAKYWGIESQVMEMQQKISRLQDEFNMDTVIEDDEARTLMAEAALKSCQETLAMLEDKQEKTSLEARDEYERIEAACQRLQSLREKYMLEQSDESMKARDGLSHQISKDVAELLQETKELEELPEKLGETLEPGSLASLSVSQLAEKIDLLVNKVITLETAVSSQTVLVNTLRSENDELNAQIRSLEEENESLSGDTQSLSSKVMEMEDKLNKVQDLNKNVESRNTTLQTNFAKARSSIDTLAEKLSSVKVDEDVEASSEKVDNEAEANAGGEPDHAPKEVSSVNRDEEKLSSGNGDEEGEEGSNLRSGDGDEEAEGGANLDHASMKQLRSGNGDDEAGEGGKNLEQISEILRRENGDVENPDHAEGEKERESRGNLDHASDELTTAEKEREAEERETQSLRERGGVAEEEVKEVREVINNRQVRRSVSSITEHEEHERVMRKSSTFSNRKTMLEILEEESEDSFQNKAKAKSKAEKDDDDISWQQILLSGMEDREKILLKEYTTILRNYKEVKKKLNEVEMKERDSQFDTTIQMRELKKAISRRDEEIIHLRRKLSTLGDGNVGEDDLKLPSISEDESFSSEKLSENEVEITRDMKGPPLTDENDETGVVFMAKSPSVSRVEEKLRTDIDAILDENLDFWFRFSTAFHQIQKFKTEVRDLEEEITKLKEKREKGGSQIKSEVMPIYKHLRDIQRELALWLERSSPLKEELKNRSDALCNIQEEITKALKEGVEEDEIKFSSHQAAKLQGEVLNMKQENDKVREELEAGLDHVGMLQLQIDKTLTQLDEEFGISTEQSEHRSHKVPLRSFIFGSSKSTKKPKNSLFSCMHPSRKYQVLRAGIRLSSHSSSS